MPQILIFVQMLQHRLVTPRGTALKCVGMGVYVCMYEGVLTVTTELHWSIGTQLTGAFHANIQSACI